MLTWLPVRPSEPSALLREAEHLASAMRGEAPYEYYEGESTLFAADLTACMLAPGGFS